MDYRHQAGAQLHQGGNHGHVHECRFLWFQLLRHLFGRQSVLRETARRTAYGGKRRAGGHGEQTHPLQSGPQPGSRPASPQPGAFPHGGNALSYQGGMRFPPGAAHHPAHPERRPHHRRGPLFSRHAPPHHERRQTQALLLCVRGGLSGGFPAVGGRPCVRLAQQEFQERRLGL